MRFLAVLFLVCFVAGAGAQSMNYGRNGGSSGSYQLNGNDYSGNSNSNETKFDGAANEFMLRQEYAKKQRENTYRLQQVKAREAEAKKKREAAKKSLLDDFMMELEKTKTVAPKPKKQPEKQED